MPRDPVGGPVPGAGTFRDGPAEPDCSKEADRTYDLDQVFSTLLSESPALRAAYERRRRETPGLTIHFEIDPERDDKRRTSGDPESGGGTTTGSCGDVHRAIIIDPVAICLKGDRTITDVLIHELGHILLCRPGMTPEGEHQIVNDFAAKVEAERYARGRRDPFEPPAEMRPRRSAMDRIRNALGAAALILGLIGAVVRFVQRLAGKAGRPS